MLHYRGSVRGRGRAKGRRCYYASRYVVLALMYVISERAPGRPTTRPPAVGIDARARIKWLNTLSRLILPREKRDANSRREERAPADARV